MPNSFGFTQETHWGNVYTRCIECDEIPWGIRLSEAEQRRHHEGHERARKKEAERARRAGLAKARQTLRQQARENAQAYTHTEGE